jgi:replication initiation protein RepC
MTHARIAPGCRRLTPMHVQVQAIAERFEGLPDSVSKGQALAAFKQAAQPLGLSPRLRDAIDVLFAFSQPQDWHPGARPIVWPSNRKLETTLGLGRRQVQNILNALIRAKLITPVDSPTGRRWGHRDTTGKIVEAYGFDLSPIGLRHAEFVALAERAAAEERVRAALRRRLTIARKAIQQIAETAIEHRLTDRDWRYWLAEALTLVLTIRDDLALEDLQAVLAELEQRRTDGETALRAAFDSQQIAPAGAICCTPIPITNQPKADNSATRNDDSEKPSSGHGNSPVFADPVSPEHSQQPLPAVTPKFVLTVSPELKPYLFRASPSWADLVEAANGLRQQLGISRPAWIDACQAMGRYQAATAVAVIAAKGETIRSPGGYLRGMTDRARDGELHLSNSLWGLARRELTGNPRCIREHRGGISRRGLPPLRFGAVAHE